jgi:biotin carboxyl carrier protein
MGLSKIDLMQKCGFSKKNHFSPLHFGSHCLSFVSTVEKAMRVSAEWPGYILDIFASEGQEVDEDEQLMLLEGTDDARTQFFVHAPESGKIEKIFVEEGDFVDDDDDLVELTESND